MFAKDTDLSKLTYYAPTTNKNGGKVVHVSTVPGSSDWSHKLRFQMSENEQTNLQTAVWGLSSPPSTGGPVADPSRKKLELTIESDALLEFLQELDERNVKTAVEKSPEWFKKTIDEDQVRNMYVPLVKAAQQPGGRPTIVVKVKCDQKAYPTNVFTMQAPSADGTLNYAKGLPDIITRNAKCLVACETVGLWFMSRQFGMSMTATNVMVWPQVVPQGISSLQLSKRAKLHEVARSDAYDEMEE